MVDYVLIDVAFAVPRLAGRLHDSRSPRCQPVASSPIRTYTQSQLTCDNDRNEAFHELLVFSKRSFHMARLRLLQGGKVEAYEQLAENIFESRIQGSAEDPYHTVIDIEHPKRSHCDCPFAKDRRVVCKHMVALCFTAFPSEADAFLREVKEPKKEEERRQQEHYKEIERYVKSLKKDELQKQLYNALLELEERNNRY